MCSSQFNLKKKTANCPYCVLWEFVRESLPIWPWKWLVSDYTFFISPCLCPSHWHCFEKCNPFEPPQDKTNRMACAPREDSDQPGHPPSQIRVFAVRMKKAWVLSYHWAHTEDSDLTDWSVHVAERLALPTSDHGVAGSNPAGGEILPDASLHRAFHVHPPVISKWLKYCWRDIKP